MKIKILFLFSITVTFQIFFFIFNIRLFNSKWYYVWFISMSQSQCVKRKGSHVGKTHTNEVDTQAIVNQIAKRSQVRPTITESTHHPPTTHHAPCLQNKAPSTPISSQSWWSTILDGLIITPTPPSFICHFFPKQKTPNQYQCQNQNQNQIKHIIMGSTQTSFLLHYIITLHHQKGTHHKTYSPLLLLLLLLWIQIADFYITNYSLLITKQTTRIHACMQRSPYLQG